MNYEQLKHRDGLGGALQSFYMELMKSNVDTTNIIIVIFTFIIIIIDILIFSVFNYIS